MQRLFVWQNEKISTPAASAQRTGVFLGPATLGAASVLASVLTHVEPRARWMSAHGW